MSEEIEEVAEEYGDDDFEVPDDESLAGDAVTKDDPLSQSVSDAPEPRTESKDERSSVLNDSRSGSFKRNDSVSGSFKRNDSVSGSFKRNDSVSGSFKRNNSVSGSFKRNDSVSGSFKRNDSVSGSFKRNDSVSGSFKRNDSVSGSFKRNDSVSGSFKRNDSVSGSFKRNDSVSGSFETPAAVPGPERRRTDSDGASARSGATDAPDAEGHVAVDGSPSDEATEATGAEGGEGAAGARDGAESDAGSDAPMEVDGSQGGVGAAARGGDDEWPRPQNELSDGEASDRLSEGASERHGSADIRIRTPTVDVDTSAESPAPADEKADARAPEVTEDRAAARRRSLVEDSRNADQVSAGGPAEAGADGDHRMASPEAPQSQSSPPPVPPMLPRAPSSRRASFDRSPLRRASEDHSISRRLSADYSVSPRSSVRRTSLDASDDGAGLLSGAYKAAHDRSGEKKDAEAGNRAFQKWVQHTEQLKANHEAEVKFISVVMALQGRLQGLEERLEAENVPLEEKQALVTKHQEVLEELDRETAKEEARHVAHEQSLVELTEDEMRLVRGVQASKRHQAEKQVEPKSHLQKYRRSSVQQEQKMLKVALEKEAAIEKQQREHLEAQERFAKMKRRTEQKIEKLTKVLEAEDNEEELTKAQRLEMMQEKMQALEELEKAEQEEEERKRLMDKEDLHLDEDEVRVLRGHKAARNLKRPEEKPLISGRDIAKQFRVDAKAEAVMAKNAKKKHQALLVMEQQRQAERVTYQEARRAYEKEIEGLDAQLEQEDLTNAEKLPLMERKMASMNALEKLDADEMAKEEKYKKDLPVLSTDEQRVLRGLEAFEKMRGGKKPPPQPQPQPPYTDAKREEGKRRLSVGNGIPSGGKPHLNAEAHPSASPGVHMTKSAPRDEAAKPHNARGRPALAAPRSVSPAVHTTSPAVNAAKSAQPDRGDNPKPQDRKLRRSVPERRVSAEPAASPAPAGGPGPATIPDVKKKREQAPPKATKGPASAWQDPPPGAAPKRGSEQPPDAAASRSSQRQELNAALKKKREHQRSLEKVEAQLREQRMPDQQRLECLREKVRLLDAMELIDGQVHQLRKLVTTGLRPLGIRMPPAQAARVTAQHGDAGKPRPGWVDRAETRSRDASPNSKNRTPLLPPIDSSKSSPKGTPVLPPLHNHSGASPPPLRHNASPPRGRYASPLRGRGYDSPGQPRNASPQPKKLSRFKDDVSDEELMRLINSKLKRLNI